ncbi:amino acid adenylation domain-containing protein [Shewanella sp. VB17]|uniref:non-ribosomal peptide synthetase n=1 Tax=Shewanella sp. VB17 TaxID=2739432 RepID=UPI001562F5A3|nr:non-ribosomal peptide synthetase [Shewanella sp. VB17]NRD72647.1 amino acid adenylation domain-containing protein [Shewanella sp. VB17]
MSMNVMNNEMQQSGVSALDFLKLHPAQEDIYYDQILNHQSPKNNLGGYTTIEDVDICILQQAWVLLHAHLDALQLKITTDGDGSPLQYIQHDKVPSLVGFHDLSLMDDAKNTALEWMQQQVDTYMDYLGDELNKISLIKLSANSYYIFIKAHHIMNDGVGIYRLHEYLHRLYQDIEQGNSTDWLLDIPQFKEAVLVKSEYLNSSKYAQDKTYWQELLKQHESHKLPTRYPLTDNAICTLALSVESTMQLYDFCADNRLNMLAVFSSVVSVVMSGITGHSDLLLNTVTHGRSGKKGMQVVGMQVNTFPFTASLNENLNVIEHIKTIMASMKKSYGHCDFPYSHLNRLANRYDALLPDIMVSYERVKNDAVEQLPYSIFKVESTFDDHPLRLRLDDFETNQSLEISASYGQQYFTQAEIKLVLERIEQVLMTFVESPTTQIKQVPKLLPHERDILLYRFNDTAADYPQDKTLHQLFAEQVAKTPDSIALVFEDTQLTYAELDKRANQLAHAIRQEYLNTCGHELMADTLIPLYLDRSLEMVISILAVLKAGGAYVPISPEYPVERTQFILTDTAAKLVVTQSQHLATLTGLSDKANNTINHDVSLLAADILSAYEDMPTESPSPISIATDLAYVIYTSGTTGRPKGVALAHNAVVNRIHWMQKTYPLIESDRVLQKTPYIFDVSVWELLWANQVGARIVIAAPEVHKQPELLQALICDAEITTLHFVPSMLSGFSHHLKASAQCFSERVKQVFCSGEALGVTHVEEFNQVSAAGSCLFNLYGPTEAAIDVSYFDTREIFNNSVPIGRAIDNIRLYVLDEQRQLMPVGSIGELYIGGAGLARGYLNRPELTQACFIDNPFATAKDIEKGYTRLYKTGDLVRYLSDGCLEYLGRNDSQVKIRGYRIELGEIETALSSLDRVKQAVVIDRERDGNKYLAAYIISNEQVLNEQAQDSHARETDSLIASLMQTLPEYMVPATFTEIDVIPLTINGKLDRRALPEPAWVSVDNYTAPRNNLEAQLCEIWQSVLGLELVGIHDNFFRSGGDSITAMKLVAAIRRKLDVDLALSALFEQKTIAGISLTLNEQMLNQDARVVIPHLDLGEEARYPVSFAQARMLFIEQFEQGSNAYHMPYLAQLDDDVNVYLLEKAINVVSERHAVMNSVYGYSEYGYSDEYDHDERHVDKHDFDETGTAYQQALDSDLTFRSQTCHDEAELLALVKADIAHPFDLQHEPSLRLSHYQLAQGQYILLMWHHIAMDGWSTDIFIRELGEVYQALKASREIDLPALDINYGDYAAWQRDYLQGEVGTRQLDYWRQTLSGYETLALPTDKPRPAQIDYRGQDSDFIVDTALSAELRALAKQQETTLYTVLLSAFYVSLAKLTGQEDIIVGSPSDNRHHAQTQSLIGMFVNSLALRAQVSGDSDISQFIQTVHKVVSQAKSNQDIPFEQLVDGLDVERDSSRHPIFQVMFSVQDFGRDSSAGEMSASQLPFSPVVLEEAEEALYSPAKFDLSLFLANSEENISGQLNYAVGLFDETTITRISAIYTRVLTAFVAEPTQKLANIDVLSTQERNTLLYDFNDTDAPYPQDKTLYQLFAEQATKTPDNIALVFEDTQLTYNELNERANQLAHAIRQEYLDTCGHELKADTLIPLYLDRSLEMVISILAVLKAGGAYVPISPEYPTERTQFILTDTAAKLVVTQSQHLGTLTGLSHGANNTTNHDVSLLAADILSTYVDMPTEAPIYISTATDLAYVIYTSGTTGQPKGVMIEHKSSASRNQYMSSRGETAKNTYLFKTSYVFDVSVSDLFSHLNVGAKIVMAQSSFDMDEIMHLLEFHDINACHFVPSQFSALLASTTLPCDFEHIYFSGENLTQEQLVHFDFNLTKVINYYGPTETGEATSYMVNSLNADSTIGRPFNDVKVYVLQGMALAPLGAIGELYIGGAGLARGYLNRPELTEQCFIDNPFATEADIAKGYTRLYKTGDLVRYLPSGNADGNTDGNLEYLGRNDSQVKIRGYRIELGEIETALSLLDSVKQAVVIDREREGNKYLAAYIISNESPLDGKSIHTDSLIASLTQALPEYMVPATFTVIDAIPLTINGKLDRRALPEPAWVSVDNYTAPRNALEAQLCEIWQSVLCLEQVGIHDNFFRSGGDSITAMKLVAAIRRELNVDLALSALFEQKTIAGIVMTLNEQMLNQDVRVIIPHLDLGDKACYPVSFAQARMLFIEQFEQGSSAYHIPYLAQLDDNVNVYLLEKAINVVSGRHAVMNSVYGYSENDYDERNVDETHTAYQRALDSHLAFRSQTCHDEDELLALVKADIAHPFDLQHEPSLRLNHYQLAQSQSQSESSELGQYILLMWHHIAMDGWSTDIFIRELGEVYQALKASREIDLPVLDINYGDYAAWQRDYLQGEVGTQQLDYWRQTLSGYETLALPTDKPRPAQIDYRGQDSDFIVDTALSAELRALAKQQETTLYTVLLSAFYVSLAKLTGQEDIIVGSPSDNRHHAQTQSLIGMFVNSLALRTQVSGDSDIAEFIQTVHKVVSQAKSNQDIPFEQLVDGLDVERDSSRHPIFQVMFSVQDFGTDSIAGEMSASQLPFSPVVLEEALYSPAKFDLSLFLANSEENISGQLNYAVGLFDETTIIRISAIYTRVLTAFVAGPAQKLANIDVLSAQERNTLLYDFNDTDAPYPQDKTLHQLFAEQVAKTPDNIALVFEGEELTYNELNERANQLAHAICQEYLDTCGHELKADTLIPLYLDRSLEMVISILAVLKAGGAYVPISPEYPAERTQFILTDTAAKLVVTQSQHLATLTGLSDEANKTINHDVSLLAADILSTYVDMPTESPSPISTATDLAYVIYTSGTTGKPKGVMVEHGNGVHLVEALTQRFNVQEREKVLLFSSYVFDVSIFEIFVGLSQGLTGYMCSESERDVVSMSDMLANESIDITLLPPVILSQLTPGDFPALKTVISGGDSPSLGLLNSFSEHCQVFNAYGPTEITVCATANEYLVGDSANNIGRGVNNTQRYVLDEYLQLTPLGANGELYIGGAGLARGYLNRPELTQACFIDNPFATEADIAKGYTRLYKTGDLVRYLPDGCLEYLGRNDSQVKIRGYRIELGEIETALSLLDSVKQAVVIDREREGNKYLAAYIISNEQVLNEQAVDGQSRNQQALDTGSLIASLTQVLPEYMVPATFTVIDAIPLTINGKLDRRALPEPAWVSVDNYTAPRNNLETQLCEIWQSVLGLEQVGVHDNFFRSGGDSITAIKLVAAIRRELDVDLALSTLFEQKTIAGISLTLNEQMLAQDTRVIIPHLDLGDKARYPVSFAQARMLFIEQFEQGSSAYHIPYLAQLDDDVNVYLLEKAINVVSGRHAVMNSVYGYSEHDFDEAGTAYQQALDSHLAFRSQTCHDEVELLVLVKADIAHPFDLQHEPSLRLNHYQLAPGQNQSQEQGQGQSQSDSPEQGQYILLMWHHIAMDGWSTDIFIRELGEVYQALSESREIDLPVLDITYGDYAAWQRDYLQGEVGTQQLDYWREALSGYENLALPTDKPRPAQIDYRGQNSDFIVDKSLSAKLRSLAKEQETTLYTVLLSAFYVSLAKLTGQEDIIVGSPSDNRHHAQTQSLIGMFVNSLALRAHVSGDSDITQFIQTVHKVVSQAKSHQDIPFEQLVDGLDVERDSSRHPIFQVMFSVQDFGAGFGSDSGMDEMSASQLPFTQAVLEDAEEALYSPAKFDLSLFLANSEEDISGQLNYAVGLFDETTIIRISAIYTRVLTAFVAEPAQKLANIDVLSAQERNTLLYDFNDTDAPYPQDKTLHQLFAEQVAKTPNNIALVFEDTQLTYRELNERANQLAHAIRQEYLDTNGHELKADTLIPLYLDRSLEMVISILAVLKAGGAYVPISPEYPAERTQFILSDTAAKLVVTQSQHLATLTALTALSDDKAHQISLLAADQPSAYENMPNESPSAISTATDLAYVIYTSGTTGKPKGVLTPHQGITSLVQNNAYIDLSADDVFLQLSDTSFDAATFELWGALTHGAKLALPIRNARMSVEQIQHLLSRHKVSVLWLTRALFDSLYIQDVNLFANLRYLLVGGEALTPALMRQLLAQDSRPEKLLNGYGPTESTTFTTTYDCESFGESVPIGKPINTRKVYILDCNRQLVPMGAVGELYIGGAGLARGYLNRPDLTQACFIDNPFATAKDIAKGYTRLYKTGDLVRYIPNRNANGNADGNTDGNLEYLGRNDSQVKIRGYRIELGEIETALSSLDSVKQAVVIDREREGNKYLAAYIISNEQVLNERVLNEQAQDSHALDTDSLIASLTQSLPEYMVPATFTEIDAIPLTINGKLDRRALPEPAWVSVDNYTAPRNNLETQLCEIWQSVLGLEQVGIHDNFFRSGGDSIISIQLVSKLRQAGFTLQVKTIFDAPTVAQLASMLEKEASSVDIIAEQGRLEGEFGLLPIQDWFFNKPWASAHHWNQAFMVQLPSGIDLPAIELALERLAERHDMLRARFTLSEPLSTEQFSSEQAYSAQIRRQRYDELSTMSPLVSCDVSALSDVELQQQLTTWQSHFSLDVGPLWQAAHLSGYPDGRSRIFFAFHHLIIDAVSWRIIAEDMHLLLTGQSLPAKTSSYRQWVAAVGDYAQRSVDECAYWQQVTAELKPLIAHEAKHQQVMMLSNELTDTLLHEANGGYHTDINDLLLSALAIALQDTLGEPVNHIVLEGHGREFIDDSLDVSQTVGWFTSMYPVKLTADEDIAVNIIQTKEMLRAMPHKGIGYGALRQAGKLTGPLPKVSFNYLGQLGGKREGENERDWSLVTGDAGVQIALDNEDDLALNINGAVQQGMLCFSVVSRLFSVQTTAFVAAFEAGLEAVINTAQCQAQAGGFKTPSDYGVEKLSLTTLSRLQRQHDIEAIYPATSLQQGFIYHHVSQPQDDAYRVQLLLDYHQEINLEVYQQAWRLASLRYPILRTAFDWQEEMLQVVTRGASIDESNFHFHDISHLSEKERELAITDIQQQDRALPFDLTQPGLIRLTLIKQADNLTTVLKSEHHSIADGWSLPVLMQAVHGNYDQLMAGETPILEVDKAYLATQQYYLDTKAETDTYWSDIKDTYQGTTDLSNLLSQKVDLAQVKAIEKPAEQVLTIQGQAYEKLKNMCKAQGVTLNVALQFAWHKLLQTYSGDSQTIVGTTVSGRDVPVEGIESSVGLYINTLPLMVNWEKDADALTVVSVLQTIQRDIAVLNSHSAVSLAILQQDGERLFHSLFVFENYPMAEIDEDNRGIESSLRLRQSVEKIDYPLSVIAFEQGDSLVVKLGFSEDWLVSHDASRLLNQLESILTSIAVEPEQLCQSLSFISEEERDTLLYDFNDTDAPYPQDKTLYQLFAEQATKTPNNIALVFEDTQLTYNELNERANQLAHAIRQEYLDTCGHELKADTLIPLYLDRSLEMVISILAVLKAGGAYVPISPEYPTERTQFILTDTAAKLVVTQSQYLTSLTTLNDSMNHDVSLLAADILSTYVDMPTESPSPISTATDLAYVIYTSGTTGNPKGVLTPHQGITSLVQNNAYIDLSADDVFLQLSDTSFDAATFELWGALTHGAKLALPIRNVRMSVEKIQHLLSRHKVSILWLTRALFDSLYIQDVNLFANLRYLLVGGEALTAALIRQLLAQDNRPEKLLNGYGPTESTTFTTTYDCESFGESVPIGKPMNTRKVYVLDCNRQLVPMGAVGELYIGGAGLARGYLNRPDLTQACFIDNPFATEADIAKGYTRLYKTGDLMRYLPDGCLEYLGRNDNQVKIRGYRIELGEIETALSSLDSVKQAVVIDREREGNKYLAAYIVSNEQVLNEQAVDGQSRNQQALETDSLIASLTQALPEYMVPATFTVIDAIPLTINGKLDRRALPEPAWVSVDNYTAPRNAFETQLCEIWQSVLGLEQVGIHDNFFRSGGDSISAIKLVSAIRRELNVDIPLSTLFSLPKIALLCDWLTKGAGKEDLLKMLTPESTVKRKIFMIHPANAGSEVYVPLALSLADEFNCIGIDNYNHHSEINISSLNQMAAMYIDLILDHTSIAEPIYLLGWSLGGQLALEMAYLLESRGAKDIKVFLLDSVMNSEPLHRLKKQMDMPSMVLKMREVLHEEGEVDSDYIEKVLQVYPLEIAMAQCEQSGRLEYAEVTLFKAGLTDCRMGDDVISNNMSRFVVELPDNNVTQWVEKPLTVRLMNNRHHGNIIESVGEIRMEIMKCLLLDEAIELI